MLKTAHARFRVPILMFFFAVVLPGVAFAQETKTCTRTMLLPRGRGQTMILPTQEPCPPGTSATKPAPFKVPRNASEWLAFSLVLLGFFMLLFIIGVVIFWFVGHL